MGGVEVEAVVRRDRLLERGEHRQGQLDDPAAVERAMKTRAIRDIASAADIARMVVFLLSDRLAGHITGEIVTVSAGMEGRLLHP